MERSELSRMYFVACNRISQASTELYERIHTNGGKALDEVESVLSEVKKFQRQVIEEVDLIRQAVKEYNK
jgi:hypothetical protein